MTKYEIGDRVEVTVIAEVTVSDFDGGGRYIEAQSDDGDVSVQLYPHLSSAKIRKLPPPKPKVGDVIDGDRLKATPWKRGTSFLTESGRYYTLGEDGRWYGNSPGCAWGFNSFDSDDVLTMVHVP